MNDNPQEWPLRLNTTTLGVEGEVEVKLCYVMVRSLLRVPLRFTQGSIVPGTYWLSNFVEPKSWSEHRRIEGHSSN